MPGLGDRGRAAFTERVDGAEHNCGAGLHVGKQVTEILAALAAGVLERLRGRAKGFRAKIAGSACERMGVPCRPIAVAGRDGGPKRVEHGALAVREPDKHPAERREIETEALERSFDVDSVEGTTAVSP